MLPIALITYELVTKMLRVQLVAPTVLDDEERLTVRLVVEKPLRLAFKAVVFPIPWLENKLIFMGEMTTVLEGFVNCPIEPLIVVSIVVTLPKYMRASVQDTIWHSETVNFVFEITQEAVCVNQTPYPQGRMMLR